MKFHTTPLTDLILVETTPVQDARGEFSRIFCDAEFSQLGTHHHWTQINISRTYRKGTVRGMHFQYPPASEAKLIRCMRGSVFDVAVDVRADSPTFLQWHGVELSENKPYQYFIPEGFAHGFQALTDDVQLLYLHSAPWDRQREGGLRYDDPAVAIQWPIQVTEVSEKDRSLSLLTDIEFAGVRP